MSCELPDVGAVLEFRTSGRPALFTTEPLLQLCFDVLFCLLLCFLETGFLRVPLAIL